LALLCLFGKDGENQPLGVANDRQSASRAYLSVGQQTVEVVHAGHRFIEDRSPARTAGLREGDVIVAIDATTATK